MTVLKRRLWLIWTGSAAATGSAIAAGWSDIPGYARILLLGVAVFLAGTIAVTERQREGGRLRQVRSGGDRTGERPRILQLANDLPDFTNRENELAELYDIVNRVVDPKTTAAPIVSINGKAGVGKTALAVHAAHRLLESFPDGEIHVDLRGSEKSSVDPIELLGELLIELGLKPHAVPEKKDERIRTYRQEMSSRRMLLLLDNAANEAQVRPLIPGSPLNATIVTSRRPLVGLAGASIIDLDVLSVEAAQELLSKIAGKERVESDMEATNAIVRLTGQLPLAVRIAAGKILQRKVQPLSDLAMRLSNERDRLDELTLGDLEVRAPFMSSYESLSSSSARAFRLMSIFDVPDFTVSLVRYTLNCRQKDAEQLIEEIQAAQLLDIVGLSPIGEIHYRYHDLIRVFARERLAEEESNIDRTLAFKRGVETYIRWLNEAELSLAPTDVHRLPLPAQIGMDDVDANVLEAIRTNSLGWFKYHRRALFLLLDQAFEEGLYTQTCLIAERLSACAESRQLWKDWRRGLDTAHKAARLAGDALLEARILFRAGDALLLQERFIEAREYLVRCLTLFTVLGTEMGCAHAQLDLGYAELELGHFDAAEDLLTNSLNYFDSCDEIENSAEAICDLALVQLSKGNLVEARRNLERAKTAFESLKNINWQAFVLFNLGQLCLREGKTNDALSHYEAALPLLETLENRLWTALTLRTIGQTFNENGRKRLAQQAWRKSHEIFVLFGDRRAAEVQDLIK